MKYCDLEPKDRMIEKSGDDFYDEAVGILLGFKEKLDERNGWIDIITVKQAVREIKELCDKNKA